MIAIWNKFKLTLEFKKFKYGRTLFDKDLDKKQEIRYIALNIITSCISINPVELSDARGYPIP